MSKKPPEPAEILADLKAELLAVLAERPHGEVSGIRLWHKDEELRRAIRRIEGMTR